MSRASNDDAVLSVTPPGARERAVAYSAVIVSFLTLATVAPFARIHLAEVRAFIPAYQAALIITDFITAALLYGQFAQSRALGLLVLGGGYLFDALMIVPHTLSYPALFSANGLLGAGTQTTAWLFVFWHGGFVVSILAYVFVTSRSRQIYLRQAAMALVASAVIVTALVSALTVLATVGQAWLPIVIENGNYSLLVAKGVSPAVCVISLVALVALWPRRNRSVLDLWLIVVLCAWICDIMLSAVVGSSRFDLGFYAGRAFGLFASSILLVMLLVESIGLQAELTKSKDVLAKARHFEAIGRLTGGVAHDFNNLLTVVSGAAEMIKRNPDDPKKVARWVESVLSAAHRGASLTQQLLTFARQQLNRPETVNPNRLLTDFEPLLRQAVGSDVEIVLAMSSVVDPVRIDPAQFESAVLNLIVNSRDALPAGGRVVITTRNVVVTEVPGDEDVRPGDFVAVGIRDTGAGMTPEVLAQAVDPFFTTKEFGHGSGLGLSQVYGFTKTSGGFLHIDSAPGAGTTITLYLPKSSAAPRHAADDAAPVKRVAGTGEHILIVEDQPDVLALASEALRDLGYRVLIATDAETALALLQRDGQIDILFSDVVMPGPMNGAQLAVEARRLRPGIRVLLTSGYAPEILQSRGISAEIELLRKPYRRDDLAARLRVISA